MTAWDCGATMTVAQIFPALSIKLKGGHEKYKPSAVKRMITAERIVKRSAVQHGISLYPEIPVCTRPYTMNFNLF